MRKILVMFLFFLVILSGCQSLGGETMVLLEEEISAVKVSRSNGEGDMNMEIEKSFENAKTIDIFEKAIWSAVLKDSEKDGNPDYDIMVEYKEGYPTHAIHLWLGEENERSVLTYMVGEGETYVTDAKTTNQLRKLLLSE